MRIASAAYDAVARRKLERGLDEAGKRGWLVMDMKRDWKVIHPVKSATILDSEANQGSHLDTDH